MSEDKALAKYLSQLDKSTAGEKNHVISNPIRHQMVAAIIHETANLTDETVNQIAPRQEPLVFLSSTAKISMALDSIPDPTKVAERLAEPEPVDTKTDTAQAATKKQAADAKESTKQDPTLPKDEKSFKM